MKKHTLRILNVVLVILCLVSGSRSFASEGVVGGDGFFISGTVFDSYEEPVTEAHIRVLVDGWPQKDHGRTSVEGGDRNILPRYLSG